MATRSKPPTPSEYIVLNYLISFGLVVVGVISLCFGYRFPAEEEELAQSVIRAGWICIGVPIGICLFMKVMKRYF